MSRSLASGAVVLLVLGSCGGGTRPTGASVPRPEPATAEKEPVAPPVPPAASQPGGEAGSRHSRDAPDPCKSNPSSPACRCEAGDAQACLEVTDAWFAARQQDAAIVKAVSLCQREEPEACLRAAQYMMRSRIRRRLGTTVVELRDRGVRLYKDSCVAGGARACFGYGVLLFTGKYVATDVEAGKQYLEGACKAGHARACSFLAVAHELGSSGLRKDRRRALVLFQDACQAGEAASCTTVGDRLPRRDRARAKALYEKACSGDDGAGCFRAGRLQAQVGEHGQAYASFVKACELEEHTGCVDAGALAEAGRGTARDPVKARELYKLACEVEEVAVGCPPLASLLARGLGGKRDWGEAVALNEMACAMKVEQGCREAARLRRSAPDWRCTTQTGCSALCDERLGRACRALGDLRADDAAAAWLKKPAGDPEPLIGPDGPDCADAADAYQSGCESGDGLSCLRVGRYEEACKAGLADGCVRAEAARYRDGDVRNRKQILRSLDTMCAGRIVSACIQLAVLIHRDARPRARKLLTSTCDRGDPASCRVLGYLLGARGSGFGASPCGDGDTMEACAGAIKEDQDRSARDEQRKQAGRDRVRRACDLGDALACSSTHDGYPAGQAMIMKARGRDLLSTQSCGRGAVEFHLEHEVW
jgi:TPR repeat protein